MSAFPELCSEWIEATDVSDMLCGYYTKASFVDSMCTATFGQDVDSSLQHRKIDSHNGLNAPASRGKAPPLITAKEYVARNALMSSLVVSWSPLLYLSSDDYHHKNCSLLALGAKSGHISFWRFHEQQVFNGKQIKDLAKPNFIGLAHAHSTWVTAISFQICRTDSGRTQLVMASGSSDGSVKIWVGDTEQLVSSNYVGACFLLLKELSPATYTPVSVISFASCKIKPGDLVLAVGKGSGMLESWVCHISTQCFKTAGTFAAHDKVITGLGWAFDGRCLYSCSQDSSLHCWVLHESSLSELPLPCNIHVHNGATDVVQLSDPCYGLVVSPGSLIMSVVHGLDSNLLNPMYEARTQKAAVEFFWIGGHHLMGTALSKQPCTRVHDNHGLSESEHIRWEFDLIWAVNQFENTEKELVIWDVLTALLLLKRSAPKFVESILCQWLSRWFPEAMDISVETVLFHILHSISTIETRKLQLLNIICRRVVLSEALDGRAFRERMENEVNKIQNGTAYLWENLLVGIEGELLQRLVAFSFKAFLHISSQVIPDDSWLPSGVAQMQQWVSTSPMSISDNNKLLSSTIRGLGHRLRSVKEYVPVEKCDYCSAPVQFEFPEIAYCTPGGHSSTNHMLSRCSTSNGDREGTYSANNGHKLLRCSTSMRLCGALSLWSCKCCKRWADDLLPEVFFKTSISPLNDGFEISPSNLLKPSKPLCPYCGILLQRTRPQFLLSPSPV